MCLKPHPVEPVPDETARIARAAFPTGNEYMRMRDELGSLYDDQMFRDLYPAEGHPAVSPWRLALTTILQFAEGLSDRQAADAVRGRIDWKYALSLELTDPGFDFSVLSEFRDRLVAGGAEQGLLNTLVTEFRKRGLLKVRGRQRTDSTHVVAAIRRLHRLESVGETLRAALNDLAQVAPEWLRAHTQPDWGERYGHRVEHYRLPKSQTQRQAVAIQFGRDGFELLALIDDPTTPVEVQKAPIVPVLRQVWAQNYVQANGQVQWRSKADIPPAVEFISSPYDPDARYGKKREIEWTGYKEHTTESCDHDQPALIIHVETTLAPVADSTVIPQIHAALARHDWLPSVHLVDTGYIDASLLVSSQRDYGVDLCGPALPDSGWQAQAAQGFEAARFPIDWAHHHAQCPAGHTSVDWFPGVDRHDNPIIQIGFPARACQSCSQRTLCTRSVQQGRTLTIRPEAEYKALQAARARQTTESFARQYARRAGIEGTLSQAVRTCGLRRSRYIGLAKTHLQHLVTAVAINVMRVVHWLAGDRPAGPRRSAFQQLCLAT